MKLSLRKDKIFRMEHFVGLNEAMPTEWSAVVFITLPIVFYTVSLQKLLWVTNIALALDLTSEKVISAISTFELPWITPCHGKVSTVIQPFYF